MDDILSLEGFLFRDGKAHERLDNLVSNFDARNAFVDECLTTMNNNTANVVDAIKGVYVTPQDFGAKGDGINDDTDAINAAITSGIKTIVIPNGNYRVSKPISIFNEGITIVGTGGRIIVDDNTYTLFAVRASHVTFDGVHFEGEAVPEAYTTMGACIRCATYEEDSGIVERFLTVKNCKFINCNRRAISLSSYAVDYVNKSTLRYATIKDCYFDHTRIGVCQSIVHNTVIDGCTFANSIDEHITVDNGCNYNMVTNNIFKTGHVGGTGCLGIDKTSNLIVTGNQFRKSDNDGLPCIAFNNNVGINNGVVVSNNIFVGGDYGIKFKPVNESGVKSANNTLITENIFVAQGVASALVESYTSICFNNNKHMKAQPVVSCAVTKGLVTDYELNVNLDSELNTEYFAKDTIVARIKNGRFNIYAKLIASKDAPFNTAFFNSLPIAFSGFKVLNASKGGRDAGALLRFMGNYGSSGVIATYDAVATGTNLFIDIEYEY